MHRSISSFVMVLTAFCCSSVAQVYDEYYPVEQPIYGEYLVDDEYARQIIAPIVDPIVAEPAQPAPKLIEWVTDYSLARKLSGDKSQPVLLFITADGCHYCEMMNRDTFGDQQVADSLTKSFVAAKLKLAPDSKLAEQLKITLYPTTIILDAEGKVLEYARGYRKGSEMHHRLQEIIDQQTRIARK